MITSLRSFTVRFDSSGANLVCSILQPEVFRETLLCDCLATCLMMLYHFMQFSEDALVVWIASRMFNGLYGNWQQCSTVLLIVYLGVVISDLVSALVFFWA